jgi:arabinose-5-phosphate isomerase
MAPGTGAMVLDRGRDARGTVSEGYMADEMINRNGLEEARDILRREGEAVRSMAELLDGEFLRAVEMIFGCSGSVVISGVGKAGIIGQKISATLASTGTPSHFMHAAEAVHGDLGRLREDDVAVVLSHSGAS